MPYATHESPLVGASQTYSVDMDLCDLMQTMKLESSYLQQGRKKPTEDPSAEGPHPLNASDEVMMVEEPSYQHLCQNTTSEPDSNSGSSTDHERYGCAYLQIIHSQMEDYPTTNGEYLDAIFTHREILYSYPAAHRECARAFTDIAYMLEKRAWRADREADTEAVTAFRHEAWVIASSLAPVPTNLRADEPRFNSASATSAPFVCIMPMM